MRETLRTFNGAEFPLKSTALRVVCAQQDLCPQCGGELDTGWECNDCQFDARDLAYPRERAERDKRIGDD